MREILSVDTTPMAYRKLDIPRWPDVDPATVVYALHDWAREDGVEVRQETIDKALAVQTVLVIDLPFIDPYAFEKTVEALNGRSPTFGYWPTMPMPAEIALAVEVMHRLKPDEEFGIGVKRYIREALGHHGIGAWPKNLEFLVEDACRGFPEDLCAEIKAGETELAKIQNERLADIADYVKEGVTT